MVPQMSSTDKLTILSIKCNKNTQIAWQYDSMDSMDHGNQSMNQFDDTTGAVFVPLGPKQN